MSEKSIFKVLSEKNVNEYTEQRDGLTYLTWSKAWAEVMKAYPDATYVIEKFENNLPYVYDENTGYMVFTKVTIGGITHEMWLPVMDGKNKAMLNQPYKYTTKYGEKTVEKATMFDINKTIMRCLVKNLAMFGLGLYIYSGEDLPDVEPEKISKEQAMSLEKVIEDFVAKKGGDLEKIKQDMLTEYKVKSFEEMTEPMYGAILQRINKAMK